MTFYFSNIQKFRWVVKRRIIITRSGSADRTSLFVRPNPVFPLERKNVATYKLAAIPFWVQSTIYNLEVNELVISSQFLVCIFSKCGVVVVTILDLGAYLGLGMLYRFFGRLRSDGNLNTFIHYWQAKHRRRPSVVWLVRFGSCKPCKDLNEINKNVNFTKSVWRSIFDDFLEAQLTYDESLYRFDRNRS